jgi:DnaJ-class molecular chaperone
MTRVSDLALLGFSPDLGEPDLGGLKARWRLVADKLHPDHQGDAEAFTATHDAYKRLLTRAESLPKCGTCKDKGVVELRRGFSPVWQACPACKMRRRP